MGKQLLQRMMHLFVRVATYFHDELHGPDKHIEELLQMGLLLELDAIPAIPATCSNDLNVRQASSAICL